MQTRDLTYKSLSKFHKLLSIINDLLSTVDDGKIFSEYHQAVAAGHEERNRVLFLQVDLFTEIILLLQENQK